MQSVMYLPPKRHHSVMYFSVVANCGYSRQYLTLCSPERQHSDELNPVLYM